MKPDNLIQSLESVGTIIPAMLASVNDEDARWKPPSQNWSILEVVCHLIDEEKDDFRYRIQSTFADPTRFWPSINPQLWAVDRNYQSRNFQQAVKEFVGERKNSVAWLKSLKEPDWHCTYEHPHLGPIRTGDLLAAWASHDHLHLRQITKRRFEMIARDAGPFSPSYAGDWGA
jgi:hypothetical protein